MTSFTLHTSPLGLWSLGKDLAPQNTADVTLESFAGRGVRKVFCFVFFPLSRNHVFHSGKYNS